MAYDAEYARMLYDPSGLVPPKPKVRELMGRMNARGPDLRHTPWVFKKRTEHKLKPLHRKILDKSSEMHKQELEFKKLQAEVCSPKSPYFCTERLSFMF